MRLRRLLRSSALLSATVVLSFVPAGVAQDSSDSKSGWTAGSLQQAPNGSVNPIRTRESHSEVNGKVIDKTSIETLGPDGRYVPYLETEKESVRVDDKTVRTTERTFGSGPDGQKALLQVKQEESRKLGDASQAVTRTTLSPDANGSLQVVQRELQESKQTSPGVRDTKTTVLTPDVNGGFTPAVQIEEHEKKNSDGTIESKKSTLFSDGAGHWRVGEVREGTSKQENGQPRSKEERVLRSDLNGKLAIVERTVSKETEVGAGEKHESVESYSINVPGSAGDGSLHLVSHEATVRKSTAGSERTVRQVERTNPGAPTEGLHVTDEVIDIVRPGTGGVSQQKRTTLTLNSAGRLGEVWVDVGKTDRPLQVDTRTSAKPQ